MNSNLPQVRWKKSKGVTNWNNSIPIIDANGKQAYLTLQYLHEEVFMNSKHPNIYSHSTYTYKDIPIEEIL